MINGDGYRGLLQRRQQQLRQNEREKEKESERRERERERERCGEGNSGSVGALEEEPGDDGRTDERTDGRDGKKYSIFSKLVHFFISLVSFSSIAKPKST